REVLGVHAREAYGSAHALLGALGAIGETLENARHLFPLARAPRDELEQAAGLLVRWIETHGLLESLDRRRKVGVLSAEAHLHFGGVHQHGALVDAVGRAVRLVEVALRELGRATLLAFDLVHRGGRDGVV